MEYKWNMSIWIEVIIGMRVEIEIEVDNIGKQSSFLSLSLIGIMII